MNAFAQVGKIGGTHMARECHSGERRMAANNGNRRLPAPRPAPTLQRGVPASISRTARSTAATHGLCPPFARRRARPLLRPATAAPPPGRRRALALVPPPPAADDVAHAVDLGAPQLRDGRESHQQILQVVPTQRRWCRGRDDQRNIRIGLAPLVFVVVPVPHGGQVGAAVEHVVTHHQAVVSATMAASSRGWTPRRRRHLDGPAPTPGGCRCAWSRWG